MNRIPTEGLKLIFLPLPTIQKNRLNEQNPDRGIETRPAVSARSPLSGLNEQNPDRGIETRMVASKRKMPRGLNEQNPDRGIETTSVIGPTGKENQA